MRPKPSGYHIDKVGTDQFLLCKTCSQGFDICVRQEVLRLIRHDLVPDPLVHKRMRLRRHINSVFLMLLITKGCFRVIHKIDQVYIIIDLSHRIQKIHFFLHTPFLFPDHGILTEQHFEVFQCQFSDDIPGCEHNDRLNGITAHHISKIRFDTVMICPYVQIIRRRYQRSNKHQQIIQNDCIEIDPFAAKQKTQQRNQKPCKMNADMRAGHIHDQCIQRRKHKQTCHRRTGNFLLQ